MERLTRRRVLAALAAAPALVSAGCGRGDETRRVVVYSALDREFSEPILNNYARQGSLRVDAKYDTESTKTVGLANAILAERARPVCDLFWNNEILNTLRLKRAGRLAAFHPAHAAAYPPEFRAEDGTWYGFAARARILLVNTRVVAQDRRPAGIAALIDPAWKGRIGLAKPLFGTTATHAACLFALWGAEEAKRYFHALKANGARVFSGNKQVAQAVGQGEIAFGLTDTDDALGELDAGTPVTIVYPDREPGQVGTLFIPNALAVLRGAPHREAAERLADYLLGPDVERALARGPSGQIPLSRAGAETALRVETPRTVSAMAVDFEVAAARWEETAAFLADTFAG